MQEADGVKYVTAPADVGEPSNPSGDPAGSPGGDWEKVKQHLAAQP